MYGGVEETKDNVPRSGGGKLGDRLKKAKDARMKTTDAYAVEDTPVPPAGGKLGDRLRKAKDLKPHNNDDEPASGSAGAEVPAPPPPTAGGGGLADRLKKAKEKKDGMPSSINDGPAASQRILTLNHS